MGENTETIIDANDFLEKYYLNQCEADDLAICLQKMNKEGVFTILKDAGVSEDKYEEYYLIMRKDFTKTFEIVEDNSFLKNDESFKKLDDISFMFSTGSHVIDGYFYDGIIRGGRGEFFTRKEVKQIWIKKEVK